MAGANPNYWAFVEAAVDLKRKGLLGKPYYVEAEYIHDLRSFFDDTTWRATYEPIRYCTHSLGPVLRLIDEDLEWVSCFDTGSQVTRSPGRHDAMAALFRTRSNVVVRLLTSFINNYPSEGHHYRVFATKGAFERTAGYGKDCPERTLFYSTELGGKRQWTVSASNLQRPEHVGNRLAAGHGGADYAVLENFFRAIRKRLPSPISLREGLRMTLPGIYAAASARRGGRLTRIRYPWS
jgi:predicted dehydrogenase